MNHFIIKWISAALITILLVSVLAFTPGVAAFAGEIAVVAADVVNVRSSPSTAGNVLTQVNRATQLPVVAKSGDWCQVTLSDGSTGWIAGWLVELKQDAGASQATGVVQVTVNGDILNIRSGPGTNYSVINQAGKGNVFSVLDEDGDWYQVQVSYGTTGWVAGWLVTRQVITPPQAVAPAPPEAAPAAQTPAAAPSTPNDVGRTGVIAGEKVNIRSGPNTDSEVMKEAVGGSQLVVLQQSGDWYRIKLQDGTIGWVAAWLVTLGPQQTNNPQATLTTVSRGNQETVTRSESNGTNGDSGAETSNNDNGNNNGVNNGISGYSSNYNSNNSATYNDATTPYSSKGSSSNSSSSGSTNNNANGDGGRSATGSGKAVDLQINANGDTVTAILRADVDISDYNAFYLNGPSRFVVDVTGIAPGTLTPDKAYNTRAVNRVRVGQQQSNPDITRIVFELNDGALCLDSISDDKKTLTVRAIVPNSQGAFRGKSVTIDPGHGGSDPGAIGKNIGLKEKDLTLDIAKQVSEILISNGAKVTMTRSTDKLVGLYEIADIANAAKTDVFVSIHINSSTKPSTTGTSTYIHRSTDAQGGSRIKESNTLAQCVQSELIKSLGLRDIGVEKADFVVLRATNMPAVLVEVAFISNQQEEQLLNSPSFCKKTAEAIASGIGVYFAVKDVVR